MNNSLVGWEYFKIICRYCASTNSPKLDHCTQCGGPLVEPTSAQPEDLLFKSPPQAVLYRRDNVGLAQIEFTLVLGTGSEKQAHRVTINREEIMSSFSFDSGRNVASIFMEKMRKVTGLPIEFFERFAQKGKPGGNGNHWEMEYIPNHLDELYRLASGSVYAEALQRVNSPSPA